MHIRRPLVFLLAFAALASGCGTAAPPPADVRGPDAAQTARYDPPRDLGPLFHDVQVAGIFPDSKTFVDAVPRRAPADIEANSVDAPYVAGCPAVLECASTR